MITLVSTKNQTAMPNAVPYQEWPFVVKLTTAISHRKFIYSDSKTAKWMMYLFLIITVAALVPLFLRRSETNGLHQFTEVLFWGFGTFLMYLSYSSYKWIEANSSWEKRFEHKSSGTHKLLHLLITAVFLLIGIENIFHIFLK